MNSPEQSDNNLLGDLKISREIVDRTKRRTEAEAQLLGVKRLSGANPDKYHVLKDECAYDAYHAQLIAELSAGEVAHRLGERRLSQEEIEAAGDHLYYRIIQNLADYLIRNLLPPLLKIAENGAKKTTSNAATPPPGKWWAPRVLTRFLRHPLVASGIGVAIILICLLLFNHSQQVDAIQRDAAQKADANQRGAAQVQAMIQLRNEIRLGVQQSVPDKITITGQAGALRVQLADGSWKPIQLTVLKNGSPATAK